MARAERSRRGGFVRHGIADGETGGTTCGDGRATYGDGRATYGDGRAAAETAEPPAETAEPPAGRRGPSRRTLLIGGLAGAAGAAAIPLALNRGGTPGGAIGDIDDGRGWEHLPVRRTPVTARQYPFNTGWVFGAYNGGSDQPGYQDATSGRSRCRTVSRNCPGRSGTPRRGSTLGLPQDLRRHKPAERPRAGRLRRRYGQRHGGHQRPDGGHSHGRLPAVLGRADRLPEAR